MAFFTPVELNRYAAPAALIVVVGQQVDRPGNASQMGDRWSQA